MNRHVKRLLGTLGKFMLLAMQHVSLGWSFVEGDPTGMYSDHQLQLALGAVIRFKVDTYSLFVD